MSRLFRCQNRVAVFIRNWIAIQVSGGLGIQRVGFLRAHNVLSLTSVADVSFNLSSVGGLSSDDQLDLSVSLARLF